MSDPRKANGVLASSTLAFTVCFTIWMMFGVIGIPIKNALHLNETEFGLLTAMPVLTGSLIRVPLGIWTDRYGGRIVFFLLMLSTVIPIWLISYAHAFWHFLVLGLFVGLAGGSFSVGTPYVARWFKKERQGLAMGVFGAGNSGAAVNKFIAPALIAASGWMLVPQVYAAMMLVAALVWAGRPTHHNDLNRSIKLADLAPLGGKGVTFLAVHRAKSVTAAAKVLGVTPSQVSKAVARLERNRKSVV